MTHLPETDKRNGVSYAFTPEGLELPIVDVTHPAFRLTVSEAEQAALVRRFLDEPDPSARLPPFLRRLVLRMILRGSRMARGIRRAEGTFLGGLDTYLLKLGPENLGRTWARAIDRRIAASLPALSVRLRLQDVARLMADALEPALASSPGTPLRLLNIAGGPGLDSLNALIVLAREQPAALAGRRVQIDVLDLDDEGPTFGARALAALALPGAPLAGREIAWRHVRYDWRDVAPLGAALDDARSERALVVVSSEGGLFEYGSDGEIVANLARLRDATPPPIAVVGSVTRDDELTWRLQNQSRAATRPRGLALFRAIGGGAGWRIERAVERPLSDQVRLVPADR